MINDPRTPSALVRPVPAQSSVARTVIKIIAAVIAVLFALLLGLIVLFLIGVETGPTGKLILPVVITSPMPMLKIPYSPICRVKFCIFSADIKLGLRIVKTMHKTTSMINVPSSFLISFKNVNDFFSGDSRHHWKKLRCCGGQPHFDSCAC